MAMTSQTPAPAVSPAAAHKYRQGTFDPSTAHPGVKTINSGIDRFRRLFFLLITQHVALKLPGCGLGKAIDEFNPPWVFPGTNRLFHMQLELFVQQAAGALVVPMIQYNERLGLD